MLKNSPFLKLKIWLPKKGFFYYNIRISYPTVKNLEYLQEKEIWMLSREYLQTGTLSI